MHINFSYSKLTGLTYDIDFTSKQQVVLKISIVIPIYNESRNLRTLFAELKEVLSEIGYDYEIIAVNDGSKDNSFEILEEIAHDKHVKVIHFVMNYGQTAALLAGIDNASGDLIVSIDGDLENDPHDIPKMLAKIEEGYDVVSGWRRKRWKGKWLSRKLPSVCANWLISRITGLKLHDYGCVLKAYKKESIAGVKLYGEMHRFIASYVLSTGAKIAEMEVNHRPRIHGKSNYGLSRISRVLLDLIVVKFLHKYIDKPMHFFGGIGFVLSFFGILAGLAAVVLKLLGTQDFVETPLPILCTLFLIVGVQSILMGILAEMLMRIYYESQDKKSYRIREKINF